jgi:uncharacterized protein involved in exopolysaccharide biosynthesis
MATAQSQGELSFSLGDLWAVLRRRIWWLVIPSVSGFTIALAAALLWPPAYQAAAIVMIEPQTLPDDLVASTIVSNAEKRFGQIRLTILARDNLTEIIDKFRLYQDVSAPIEEKVEKMRVDISIEPLPPAIVDPRKPIEIESFRIAYQGREPKVVAEVTNQLTREFIAANMRSRTALAEDTREFIEGELVRTEEDRERLAMQLMEYREQYQGMLPEDLAGNGRVLERLSLTYRDTLAGLEVGLSQMRAIDSQIQELRSSGTDRTDDPIARKKALQLGITRFLAEGKTEKHPDLVITRAEIARLDEVIAHAHESNQPLSPAEITLRNERRGYEVRAIVLKRQLERLEPQIAEVEAKVMETPKHRTAVEQMEERIEGFDDLIAVLQEKKLVAEMGEAVELVQKGEKFRIVENAVAPSTPTKPNRRLVVIVGTVLGIAVGFALLAAREVTDQSFHSVADLQTTLGLPVLGAVPDIRLPADLEASQARLRRGLMAGVVFLAVLVGGGLMVYVLSQLGDPTGPSAALEIFTGV